MDTHTGIQIEMTYMALARTFSYLTQALEYRERVIRESLTEADVVARFGSVPEDALALPTGSGSVYPAWQFDAPGMGEVVRAFRERGMSPWASYAFLTLPTIRLGGETPLQRILRGDVASVLRVDP